MAVVAVACRWVNVTTGPVMNMDGQNFVEDFMSGLQYAAEEGASLALSTLGQW